MTADYEKLLIDLCQKEAQHIQRQQGREEKGIVSTQVLAVIKVLARLLSVLQIDDRLVEVPK